MDAGPTVTISAPSAAVLSSLSRGALRGITMTAFDSQRTCRVRDALGVVAAGVGDDAAPALLVGERCDLVVSAANLEGADRLQALRLQPELPARCRDISRPPEESTG